jgi:hypothetical protein
MGLIKTEKTISIKLTKSEWSWCNTWISGIKTPSIERMSEDWFIETKSWFKDNVSLKYLYDLNIEHYDLIEVLIPRNILRIFVFSVGRIAYDFDVKSGTSTSAYEIITKIEEQIKVDEYWNQNRF